MDFRVGHDIDVRLHETGGLSLADEGRSSGNDRFRTGDVHRLEEEPGTWW